MFKDVKVITLALFLFAFSTLRADADMPDVQIESIHVAGPVYMLVGSGGNIGVSAGEDGILLIDDQFTHVSGEIQAVLDAISSSPLRFVLNTHWHGDHTGGNEVFGLQAPIIAHINVRKRLLSGGFMNFFGKEVEPVVPGALPLLTYDDGVFLHLNGEDIRVVHKPAHTDGDSIVIFYGSNVVHMGDLFFSGKFPFIDLDSGGSVPNLLIHIANLLAELPKDVKIIPGHGPLSGYEDLERYHEMLVATTGIVREHIQAGRSEEEAVAAGFPDQWKEWGSDFINEEKWIRIAYQSYSN